MYNKTIDEQQLFNFSEITFHTVRQFLKSYRPLVITTLDTTLLAIVIKFKQYNNNAVPVTQKHDITYR